MATRARNARTTNVPSKRRAPAGAAAAGKPHARAQGLARWPELKLDIVRRYAAVYSTILSRQPGLTHYYIEGFTGAPAPARVGRLAAGSPLNALLVTPPFRHHYLVDLDGGRAPALRRDVGKRDDVTLLEGDANRILLEDVLPRVRSDEYRRALCVLDPSPAHVDWRVLEMAGRLRTVDLFVTLTAADAHGWLPEASRNGAAAQAFKRRLHEDAGFANVLGPLPLPLRNGTDAPTGHVFFASKSDTANHVVEDIFAAHGPGAPAARKS